LGEKAEEDGTVRGKMMDRTVIGLPEAPEKYAVLFAPDGQHYQTVKEGSIGNMWDYFNFSPEIQSILMLNQFSKFKLVNMETDKVIALKTSPIGNAPRN
jgi:hypothetical protein